jgi:SAM-dependent methyltransferase
MKQNKFNCRFCNTILKNIFINLGISPNANSYIKKSAKLTQVPKFPLEVFVCNKCLLVQLPEYQSPSQLFSNYAYFSSYSESWLKHAKSYAEMIIERFKLKESKQVIEIGSNDGYLLQYFKRKKIPVLGIDPAANIVKEAEKKGIPTIVKFFSAKTARAIVLSGIKADLLIGNNVLAHVPDLNDFVQGMKQVLGEKGVITMEFPHLLKLIEENQFDTIYHKHFSYFSFSVVQKIFEKHGLLIFDVEELPTHGGSLRIYASHKKNRENKVSIRVNKLLENELVSGLNQLKTLKEFNAKAEKTKKELLKFLKKAKQEGKTVIGYGAPAKGNTLLNYCGITSNLLAFTVDRNPEKQNKYLPGSRIPVYSPDKIFQAKPDYILIFPWNIKQEIMRQMKSVSKWGCRFVVPIPELIIENK